MTPKNLNRRGAIAAMASIPVVGMSATQVKAEVNPFRAAYQTLVSELRRGVPEGMELHDPITLSKAGIHAMAFPPNYQHGMPRASYDEAKMRWLIKEG